MEKKQDVVVEKRQEVLVGWFEIPVRNMDRAMAFYGSVFNTELSRQDLDGFKMAFFPMLESSTGAGGSLVEAGDNYTPSHEGTLVYFSCEDLDHELSRVKKAGGKVLQSKTEISPEYGYMGLFEDTEGNRVALHSNK